MISHIMSLNRWLGKRMLFVTVLAIVIGFNFTLPSFLLSERITLICFVYLTFITSLDIHFREFVGILKKPILPIGMLFLIHGFMPIIALGVGSLFYSSDLHIRLGFLISSVIPVGLTSIVWTSLAGGDVVLALVVVMLDTLLSPLILPGFFSLVLGQSIELNYSQMVVELILMVALPSLAAMIINDLTKGKLKVFSHSIGGLTAKLGIFFIILINAAMIATKIIWGISILKLFIVILLLMLSGYLVGYLASYALRVRSRSTVITMVYNVGMRNINFGFVLAMTYFPTAVAIPVVLASVYNQPLASIVTWLFNRKNPASQLNPDKN